MKKGKFTFLNNFINNQCCNYTYGMCLGVDFNRVPFNMDKKCLILEEKECYFFEKCVIDSAKEEEYEKLIEQYRLIDKDFRKNEKVNRCECGKILEKRKRICKSCQKKELKKKRKGENNNVDR